MRKLSFATLLGKKNKDKLGEDQLNSIRSQGKDCFLFFFFSFTLAVQPVCQTKFLPVCEQLFRPRIETLPRVGSLCSERRTCSSFSLRTFKTVSLMKRISCVSFLLDLFQDGTLMKGESLLWLRKTERLFSLQETKRTHHGGRKRPCR